MKIWLRNLGMAIVWFCTKWAIFAAYLFLLLDIYESDMSSSGKNLVAACASIACVYWFTVAIFKQWDSIVLLFPKRKETR